MTVFPDFPLYNSACCTNTIINSAICTLENVLDFTINDLDALSMAPSHIILGSTSSSDPLLPHPLGILYLLFCPLAVFPCFLSVSCSEVTPLFSIQSSLLCNPIHSTQMILVNDQKASNLIFTCKAVCICALCDFTSNLELWKGGQFSNASCKISAICQRCSCVNYVISSV